MKLKHLLFLSFAALGATGSYAAETITVDGSPMSLPYSSGDMSGKFLDTMGDVNSSITYSLNVEKAGDYILYLHTGNKLNGGQTHEYAISINDEVVTSIFLDKFIGGNWNNFVIMPAEISLPEGPVTLKIQQLTDRCYINKDNAPYIVPAGTEYALGEDEVSIDVMHPDPSSTLNFTAFAGYGVDNSGYGDNKSVLVTGEDRSGSNATKMQACYPKTKLYYPVNVAAEGEYPVSIKGFFYSAATRENLPDFPVSVKAYWNGNSFTDDVVTGFETVDAQYSEATGTLNLKKGAYMLEISSNSIDQFLMAEFKIGVPEETSEEGGETIGKFVPVVSLEEPASAYFGHAFTINGSVALDQEDDEIASAAIYLGEEKLDDLEMGDGNIFSYDVEDTDLFPTVGEYTFMASVTTERGYTATATVTVDLQKKMFQIEAFANAGGSIEFEGGSEKVAEGDDITVTITPDEGYVIESIRVDDEPVDFTVNDEGAATYTFENVTSDMMIEAAFAKIVFNVSASVKSEGGKIEAAETVEYGDNVVVKVTPDDGFEVSELEVNGESVTFTADDSGVVRYTVENVTADLSVAASFVEKEEEEEEDVNSVENVTAGSHSFFKVNNGVLINVAEESHVALCDLAGNVFFNGYVCGSKVIECNVKGVVILSIDGNKYKVIL